jgi:ubiquitin-like-conjugating enzyme ATG10
MGYLSRQAVVHHKTRGSLWESDSDDLDGDDWEHLEDVEPDDAVATTAATASDISHRPPAICQQYVVYSATFQVPAFYFSISDASASP